MAASKKKKERSKKAKAIWEPPFNRGDQVVFSQDGESWGIGVYSEHEREDDEAMGLEYIPTECPHRIYNRGWFRYCKKAKGFDQKKLAKVNPVGW